MIRYIMLTILVLAAPAAGAPRLQVHLPRTVQVETETLSLGAVSVVRAEDETLARQASEVPLGRAPRPKEEIAIDRATILGRLAANGIPASTVQLSGADRVVVCRNEKAVPADDLVAAAKAALEKDRPAPAGSEWRLSRGPQEMIVAAVAGLSLEAAQAPHEVAGEAKVEVAAVADGRRLAARTMTFRLGYVHREAVAAADIPAGTMISAQNTQIRTVVQDSPPPADWAPPYGLVAAQTLRAGTVIRPAQARAVRPAIAVRRNENVIMQVQGAGFVIRAVGQALDEGRPGDLIKVRNVDSKRIVVARVAADGSVEPVFDEVKP